MKAVSGAVLPAAVDSWYILKRFRVNGRYYLSEFVEIVPLLTIMASVMLTTHLP